MAYAVFAEVQQLIAKWPLSTTTKPTTAQATDMIDQIAGEMDTAISSAGYAVPVTAPAHFLEALKLLNAEGTAMLVLKSMFPQRSGASEGSPSEYALYARNYNDGLRRLQSGEGIPPDAATGAGSVAPSSYFTRNPDQEEDLGEIAEPFFKRNQVF